jgi:hypothetical protein
MHWILLSAIFLCPFISSKAWPDIFPWVAAALALSALCCVVRWRAAIVRDRYLGLTVALWLGAILSAAFLSPTESWAHTLSFVGCYLTGILLFLAGAAMSGPHRKLAVLTLVFSASLISAYALYQFLWGFPRLSEYVAQENITHPFILEYIAQRRPFATFITPNILGGYLALCIPLALADWQSRRLAVLLAAGTLLTRSLGSFAAILIVCAAALLWHHRHRKIKPLLLWAFSVASALAAVLIASRYGSTPDHFTPGYSLAMRLHYLRETARIIFTHPFSGIGFTGFNLDASRYSHNAPLQLWAQMGIFGPIAYLWTMGLSGWAGLRAYAAREEQKPFPLLAGLLCSHAVFFLTNLTDFGFFLPEISFLWCLIAGMLYASARRT